MSWLSRDWKRVGYKALGNYASNLALTYIFIIFNKIINMGRTINVNGGKQVKGHPGYILEVKRLFPRIIFSVAIWSHSLVK